MKTVFALLALACSLLLVSPAEAETWSKRLTREKPDENFTIKVDRLKDAEVGEFLQFRVSVKLKDSEGLIRSRNLRVFHGAEFVSSCEVQPTGPDGSRVFSFRVAAKYLEKSTFSYTDSHESGQSSIGYWFYLKDFVEPK